MDLLQYRFDDIFLYLQMHPHLRLSGISVDQHFEPNDPLSSEPRGSNGRSGSTALPVVAARYLVVLGKVFVSQMEVRHAHGTRFRSRGTSFSCGLLYHLEPWLQTEVEC